MKMPSAPVSVTTSAPQTKPSRPREVLDPPRQVHFAGEGTKVSIPVRGPPARQEGTPLAAVQGQRSGSSASASGSPKPPSQVHQPGKQSEASSKEVPQESSQPQSFPGVGHFPSAGLSGLQWHRSAVPGQTLGPGFPPPGGHLSAGHNSFVGPPGFPHPQNNIGCSPFSSHYPTPLPTPPIPTSTTFIGRPSPPPASHNMADYQNTAPPNRGQCFQPPVPDTTFGPMYHVYTPRFDPPGMVPQGPVGHHPVQFLPFQAVTVGVQPQAYFTPNYAYYPPIAAVPMGQCYMPQQQMYGGQPMITQPPMTYGQHPPMAQHYQPVPMAPQHGGFMPPPGGGPPTVIPIMAGNPGPNVSEVAGVGRTPMEEAVRQHHFAHANKLFEPQDFKPADDDPSRFYFVREVDGNWTQRNRFTIENTGDCRWFVTPEGWFYAVRQPD